MLYDILIDYLCAVEIILSWDPFYNLKFELIDSLLYNNIQSCMSINKRKQRHFLRNYIQKVGEQNNFLGLGNLCLNIISSPDNSIHHCTVRTANICNTN